MNYYLTKARQKSDFDSTVVVEPGDRLVTLSTCAYAFENARYITIGKLTKLWEYVEPLPETTPDPALEPMLQPSADP